MSKKFASMKSTSALLATLFVSQLAIATAHAAGTQVQPNTFIAATAYYDTVIFARFVKAPVLMSSGLIDTACPPMTVLSIDNTLNQG